MVFFGGEERMKHRDTTERGHKRHICERFSGEKEQYRERKHRDRSGGQQKPCRSNRDTHAHILVMRKRMKDDRFIT